jgi:hypothetical protein
VIDVFFGVSAPLYSAETKNKTSSEAKSKFIWGMMSFILELFCVHLKLRLCCIAVCCGKYLVLRKRRNNRKVEKFA